MGKYVRETKAGKSIKAYAIMKGRRHVASVQVHYGDSGSVLVNVWQDTDGYERSAKAAGYKVDLRGASEMFCFQSARAGGGGYDKFTTALAGMWIDGHKMTDHCDWYKAPKKPVGCALYPHDMVAPKGYRLANWRSGDNAGWENCFRLDGLNYLRDIGYAVVQVI